jgi:glycosyltransferase involved in cell wall biosynthesis
MSPATLRIVDPEDDCSPRPGQAPYRIALIGNYPPRRCGIATFTSDVYQALIAANPSLAFEIYAMTDTERGYAYPPEVTLAIAQERLEDYLEAADRLNHWRPDAIFVQHEFGIFGGPAGEHIVSLLEATDRPVVVHVHTVLEAPDPDQRRVFERLLNRAAKVVVMAERGRDILRRTWRTPPEKIVLIPHGAPDRPFVDTEPFKAELGLAGREMLFTFGLISPNKGIEYVIQALPEIVAARPNAVYVVLGATHPNLIAREGERYRMSLISLAERLGVADHVLLVDQYTDTARLIDYLQAADVYVTPYLNVQQITSGTLSYAAALGKPIVSTTYWHAEELLKDGLGRLVPFASSDAIRDAVVGLLSDSEKRIELGRSIYDATRETVWNCFGVRMLEVFERAIIAARRPAPPARPANAPRPAPSLAGVRRLTDSCGIIQHGLFALPDRRHGYCVDDNARGLILLHRLPGPPDTERRALTTTYAAFVQHAWNEERGRFRNFMSYERQWREEAGSDDSTGRAVWSVAVTVADMARADLSRWAESLMDRLLPHLPSIHSPRAEAFILLGMCAMIASDWRDERVHEVALAKAERLAGLAEARKAQGLPWFEATLAYDNARMPEALIRAGRVLGVERFTEIGLETLGWLCRRQTDSLGAFLPVATTDFGRPLSARGLFDQQPVEAAATVDACEAAWIATGRERWAREAERAFDWYFGANTLGAQLATEDGGCYDGLTWAGPNENQGAESVLSFQLAACTLQSLTDRERLSVKTASDL